MLLAALALSALAPAFHIHQFGEATRMARDAGVSALMTGGTLVALFAAVRTVRRALESGTAAVALAHGVSRGGLLTAQVLGVLAAYLVFAFTLAAQSLVVTLAAAKGGALAHASGDIARLWGPALALALLPVVLPLVLAAALNRFARWRFTAPAVGLTAAFAFAALLAALVLTPARGFAAVLFQQLASLGAVMAPVPLWVSVAASAARFNLGFAALAAVLIVLVTLPLGASALFLAPLTLYLGILVFRRLELS